MFVRTKTMEARVADLKEAHVHHVKSLNKLMEALADEVDWLRAQALGRPHFGQRQALNPSQQPTVVSGEPVFLTEEQEDIMALHEHGHINDLQLQALEAELGVSLRVAE